MRYLHIEDESINGGFCENRLRSRQAEELKPTLRVDNSAGNQASAQLTKDQAGRAPQRRPRNMIARSGQIASAKHDIATGLAQPFVALPQSVELVRQIGVGEGHDRATGGQHSRANGSPLATIDRKSNCPTAWSMLRDQLACIVAAAVIDHHHAVVHLPTV